MIGWLKKIRARYRWQYVGTASSYVKWMDDGQHVSTDLCHWHLFERGDGKRKFKRVGAVESGAQQICEAKVFAWTKGGKMPSGYAIPAPAPTPPKKANLVSFPGGKGGAA